MARKKNAKSAAAKMPAAKPKKMGLVDKIGMFLGLAGVLMFLFGLVLFLMPKITVDAFVLIFGFVLVVSGMFKLFEAFFVLKGAEISGYLAAGGAFALLVGLLILAVPQYVAGGVFLTFGLLAFLVALIAIVSGVAQVAYSLKVKGRAIPMLLGLILVILGIGILLNPFGAAVGIAMVIGFFSMIYGLVLIALAMSLKKILEC
ncbi:MAG: DUF308 domain-containing protein [Candidatus Micrarchaeota archaeon]|nr:DUF308 domain-containing protein [Candidatus Micrarchaeota archaeon]